MLVLGRVEVFPNSTISPLVLSHIFGIFLLYDKLRFPFGIIKILWSNTAAETERKIGKRLVARIGLNSVEKWGRTLLDTAAILNQLSQPVGGFKKRGDARR